MLGRPQAINWKHLKYLPSHQFRRLDARMIWYAIILTSTLNLPQKELVHLRAGVVILLRLNSVLRCCVHLPVSSHLPDCFPFANPESYLSGR